jgi:hypothetical protein
VSLGDRRDGPEPGQIVQQAETAQIEHQFALRSAAET